MGHLDGRVVLITGGGGGLGREHALLCASEGARVVVNDLARSDDGAGSAAQDVVAEIRHDGGEAVANEDSVASWTGAERMIAAAVDTFGDLHVVINNAGMLRDRFLVNMSEDEFDDVMAVHLKGTFAVTRHAAGHWRSQAKDGVSIDRCLINTSSGSGLHGNPGQANYAAAKAGIAALTLVAGQELARYGVRANCIAPVARTRLTESTPGLGQVMQEAVDHEFDDWHPANISPLVAMLAREDCELSGHVFRVLGGMVGVYRGWSLIERFSRDRRWTIGELIDELDGLPVSPAPEDLGDHTRKAAEIRDSAGTQA